MGLLRGGVPGLVLFLAAFVVVPGFNLQKLQDQRLLRVGQCLTGGLVAVIQSVGGNLRREAVCRVVSVHYIEAVAALPPNERGASGGLGAGCLGLLRG